jgi:2-oxoglutarate dehydrogenase E1 component
LATSTLEDLADGQFQNVIADNVLESAGVKRAIICSGKVYYHLLEEREARGQTDVALIRLEQLYPFPEIELKKALAPYRHLQDVLWCQEEPMNQGAWYSSQHHLRRVIHDMDPNLYVNYVGREASAAPAAGYMALHMEQQNKFINEALTL